ncbi:MAG: hypothetical protein PHV11_03790, partial [Candidatus Bipolaricaulis sp.]|nr:hypothetical protein [Candidatus Bipolaricaulis sp.]
MAQTYAQLKASAEDILDTIGTDVVSDAVLETMQTDAFIEGLRLLGEYVPHIVTVPYTIESRTGTASSTLANNLVDATEDQFLSTDVGKVVYNTTDKTWAEIKTYTSETTVVLSKDIMASGEKYEIYNTECFNSKQINISDVTDYLWVIKAEYPLGYPRNVKHISRNPDIIELGIDFEPDDSKVLSSGTQPDTEVLVYFAKRQKLSQLTDTAAAVNLLAGYAAGSTSIILDALQASGTIEQDQEFTIANVRGIYTVTA